MATPSGKRDRWFAALAAGIFRLLLGYAIVTMRFLARAVRSALAEPLIKTTEPATFNFGGLNRLWERKTKKVLTP